MDEFLHAYRVFCEGGDMFGSPADAGMLHCDDSDHIHTLSVEVVSGRAFEGGSSSFRKTEYFAELDVLQKHTQTRICPQNAKDKALWNELFLFYNLTPAVSASLLLMSCSSLLLFRQ